MPLTNISISAFFYYCSSQGICGSIDSAYWLNSSLDPTAKMKNHCIRQVDTRLMGQHMNLSPGHTDYTNAVFSSLGITVLYNADTWRDLLGEGDRSRMSVSSWGCWIHSTLNACICWQYQFMPGQSWNFSLETPHCLYKFYIFRWFSTSDFT